MAILLVVSCYLGRPKLQFFAQPLRLERDHCAELRSRDDMRASWSISKNDAFVCEAEDLRRLIKLLESHASEVSWKIVCTDGIDRSGEDLAALLEFDNAPNRRIQRLHLRACSNDTQCSAYVWLGGSFNVLEASIDGSIEFVDQLRPALESQLYGLRAWYTRIARTDFVKVSFLLLFSVSIVFFLLVAFGFVEGSNESPEPTEPTAKRGFALAVTVVWGGLVVGWGLNKIRERLFPPVTFAMGQGKRRHEILEKVRWSVTFTGVTLLAGLLLSLLGSF